MMTRRWTRLIRSFRMSTYDPNRCHRAVVTAWSGGGSRGRLLPMRTPRRVRSCGCSLGLRSWPRIGISAPGLYVDRLGCALAFSGRVPDPYASDTVCGTSSFFFLEASRSSQTSDGSPSESGSGFLSPIRAPRREDSWGACQR